MKREQLKSLKIYLSFVILLLNLCGQELYAQGVGISESSITPDASAILELRYSSGTYKGFLLPRMTTANRNTIAGGTPPAGLSLYNTSTNTLDLYAGSWISLAPLSSPTFTGTVTLPTPFTLGATSVTSTGTQLNYLNASTGTTGTTSTNLVFSASPTFTGTPTLPTGTIATTQTFGDNTTALATTAFVQSETPAYSRVAGANATTGVGALTNITGLTFATAANTVYEFEACLTVQSSSAAGNQYGVQHSTAGASVEALITGTLAAATQKTLRINALNTAATPFVTVAATGGILIKGIFVTGANAGNLTIQHNKITGGTSTVFINSYLKVTKVQ